MNTQAIQFIGKNGKMFRLPADATISDLVTVFGVNSIRMIKDGVSLVEGEYRVTLQNCNGCKHDIVSANINGYCQNCEAKNENP